MANKQTAVEWLHSELHKQCMFDGFAWEDRNYFIKLLDKAKEMEKDQHDLTFARGVMTGYANANGHESVDFEQYYNENYGK